MRSTMRYMLHTAIEPSELPLELLENVAAFVTESTGLVFRAGRLTDLERGIASAARELDFASVEQYTRWLLTSKLTRGQLDSLVAHLTVGETYFFREPASFEALRCHVLPAVLRNRKQQAPTDRQLRIWSAGCSTGEEAYTLAMLLEMTIADLDAWDITILATDINVNSLRIAQQGAYRDWSFRGVPDEIRERFFRTRADGLHEVIPRIRRHVNVTYLNLAEDVYPALLNKTNAMDLILCRNVLMYFEPTRAARVVERFGRALRDGGYLAVSAVESTISGMFSGLSPLRHDDAKFYRKDQRLQQDMPVAVPTLPAPASAAASETTLRPTTAAPAPSQESHVRLVHTEAGDNALNDQLQALFRAGHYAQAATVGEKMLARRPGDTPVMALLARIQANLGNLKEALEWSQRVLADSKLDPVAHYLHANILLELGRSGEAAASFERVLYIDQNFVLAHFALGMLACTEGPRARARKHLQNALASLAGRNAHEEIAEAEGMTVGRLAEVIGSMKELTDDAE